MRDDNIFNRIFTDFFEFLGYIIGWFLYAIFVAPIVYIVGLFDFSELDSETKPKALALAIIFAAGIISFVILVVAGK